ncbi:MAG: PAS domain S-box protein [Chloroflexi bacterium]|nr:PAS domain S-box protein [Chloroflexota bacterium]
MFLEYFSVLLITIFALILGVTLILAKKYANAVSLWALAAIITIWIVSYLLYKLVDTPSLIKELASIHYLCMAGAAIAQLYFSLSYTYRTIWMNNRTWWLNRIAIVFFILVSAIIQAIYWVEPLRMIFFSTRDGIGEQINEIYVLNILVASIVFFVDTFARKPRIHFFRAGTIMIGAVIPFISRLVAIFGVGVETDIFLSILSYSLALAGFSYGISSNRLIETTPITRDFVVEGMDDGWMVVDRFNRVLDLNSSAEEMVGLSQEKIYGKPVDQILPDWPGILKSSQGNKEIEMRRSVKSQKDWRYLNIRISKLTDQSNANFGYLILWRDITGRKMADDARQRARDELFVLLNAVSSAASRSMNLEDFLSEASYQIVYSFQSQAVVIFLTEEDHGSQTKLVLKSQFGLSPDQIKEMNQDKIASSVYDWLMENEENHPLIISNFNESMDVPAGLKNFGFESVVLIPLIIYTQHENTVIGCLCLGRHDNTAYNQDEVIRLTTISNQIATLIDNNRRRQFAIALSERQRLLRDLHDSVSQKLYGLVALTEAAQAGIEAGSEIAPLQVLTRIGENARQAVKEMRLFLYEMQPVDLKDGLVSTLHHRLVAVEGRADIKARLLADEDIQLSKDKEIALYYIAQEALNNILRHAHAKTVSITLKQTRLNVILKIIDDGRGFDIKKIDQGGLGLPNMKQRALQVNGKFKIVSAPGEGTKITIVVGRKS